MGLDTRPMGKPKPGFEERFLEIFRMIREDKIPKPAFIEKLKERSIQRKRNCLKSGLLIKLLLTKQLRHQE